MVVAVDRNQVVSSDQVAKLRALLSHTELSLVDQAAADLQTDALHSARSGWRPFSVDGRVSHLRLTDAHGTATQPRTRHVSPFR